VARTHGALTPGSAPHATFSGGNPEPCNAEQPVVEFQYFMVRVRRATEVDAADRVSPTSIALSGVVERLNSGEKRAFATANELLQLVTTWPESPSNVQPAREPRNTQP
jgi:hypothetical protein